MDGKYRHDAAGGEKLSVIRRHSIGQLVGRQLPTSPTLDATDVRIYVHQIGRPLECSPLKQRAHMPFDDVFPDSSLWTPVGLKPG